jgi:hypothetical protein
VQLRTYWLSAFANMFRLCSCMVRWSSTWLSARRQHPPHTLACSALPHKARCGRLGLNAPQTNHQVTS